MDVDRAIDRALFIVVLCMPLLPTGPAYLGFESQTWLPAAVLALPVLAAVALRHRRRKTVPPAAGRPPAWLDPIAAAWSVFFAAAVGAGVVGLAATNDFASPVFRYNLRDALRLLGPIDRAWDPLYPLLPVLVIAQGLLVYGAVRALCLYTDDPRRRSLSVLRAWAYGFGLVGGVAVLQYLTRFRLLPFWVEANPELTRSHATLDDPNALGSYLVLGILLCLGLAAASRGWRAVTTAALAALGAVALLTTASRAAIGGLALVGLAAIAMPGADNAESPVRIRWRRGARWLLAAGAAVLVASLLARALIDFEPLPYRPGNVVSALTGVLDPRIPLAKSLENRGAWWGAALRMARDAPVLGVGLGRFPLLLPEYAGPAAGNLDAHNYFLQVLAEMGIVGLLAFGALLAAVFGTLASLLRSSAAPRLAGAALLGSIAFVATFVTGHPLLLASGQVLWAAMLAAVVVAARTRAPSGEPLQRRSHEDGAALPVARPARSGTRTALVCGGVLAAYLGAALWLPPFATPSKWGYSYGLYAQETDARGRSFRWTGGLALLQLPVPAGATELRAEVTVAPALRSAEPTRVRVSLDRNGSGSDAPDRRDFNIRRLSQSTSYTVSLQLAADHRFDGDVRLRIEVDPTFVPARAGDSSDHRQLGVQLFPPRFDDGNR